MMKTRTIKATVRTAQMQASEVFDFGEVARRRADDSPTTSSAAAPTNVGTYIAGHKEPLSRATKHLLIAAGCIGGAMIIAFAAFLIYRRRKAARDLLDEPKITLDNEPSVSAPLGSNWGAYRTENKSGYTVTNTFKASTLSIDNPSYTLEHTYTRPGTSSSNRPLNNAAIPTRAPFLPPNRRTSQDGSASAIGAQDASVLVEAPFKTTTLQPAIPIERPPSQESSTPPYLVQIVGNPHYSPPKISRFSWTNSQWTSPSQAPKTPSDARFGPSMESSRYSAVSEADSVPRFRTVESWVGNQASRYEEAQIQDRIQMRIDAAIREVNQVGHLRSASKSSARNILSPPPPSPPLLADGANGVPAIPRIPVDVQDSAASSKVKHSRENSDASERSQQDTLEPLPASINDMKGRVKHTARGSDASIFQVHPGTKIDIPTGGHIPSVILDGKLAPYRP